jgi:putative redox protein
MKALVSWHADVQFVAESGSGHAVVLDGAPEYGGKNTGMRPMEMVLAGAAACTAFDVVTILKKMRQDIASVVVEAQAERADTDPKVFTAIHLVYKVSGHGLDAAKVEQAVRLSKEKYCSATIMLAATAKVTFSIEMSEAASSAK